MPEGPEVQTIVNNLNKKILNNIILDIEINTNTKELPIDNKSLIDFKKLIIDRKIKEVHRIGKNIIIELDNDYSILIHLLMTGQLWLQTEKPRYYKASIILDKNILHLADRRNWVKIKLFSKRDLEKYIFNQKLGIDLLRYFEKEKFENIIKGSNRKIYTLMLDQKKLSGLGNIYVNEILFSSKIVPNKISENLTEDEINRLYKSTKHILKEAIRHNGTTFSDYITPSGNKGMYQNYLKVYKKKSCIVCNKTINKIKIGGRTAYYCSSCQNNKLTI